MHLFREQDMRLPKVIHTGLRHWKMVLLIGLFVFLTGETTTVGWATAKTSGDQVPRLIPDRSVNPDFETLAMETWGLFLKTFNQRSDCFGDVYLTVSMDLKSRAAYDPKSATVTVRVPGTKAMLQSALIHEWAHHVEFQCAVQQEIRPEFLIAMGVPKDTPWRPEDSTSNISAGNWAEIPSEHYAEAAIGLVLGERHVPTNIRVSREELAILKKWVSGS